MHYNYEFKWECVHKYKNNDTYSPAPENVKQDSFKEKVRILSRLYDNHGPEILRHSNKNRSWTQEEKLVLINQYKAGKTIKSIAFDAGINDLLSSWIRKYEQSGHNGLVESKKGRTRKNSDMSKKTAEQRELNESKWEELIR